MKKKIVCVTILLLLLLSNFVTIVYADQNKTLTEEITDLANEHLTHFFSPGRDEVSVQMTRYASMSLAEIKEEILYPEDIPNRISQIEELRAKTGTLIDDEKYKADWDRIVANGQSYYFIGIVNACMAISEKAKEIETNGVEPSNPDYEALSKEEPTEFTTIRTFLREKLSNSGVTANDLKVGGTYSDDTGLAAYQQEVKTANTGKTKDDINSYIEQANTYINQLSGMVNTDGKYGTNESFSEKQQLLIKQLRALIAGLNDVLNSNLAQDEYLTQAEQDYLQGQHSISGIIIRGENAGTTGDGESDSPVDNPDIYNPGSVEVSSNLIKVGGVIVGAIKIVGIIVAIIMTIVLGIKYMIGSVSEKAEYKKVLVPYLAGIILLAAGGTILEVIFNLVAGTGIND